MFGRTRSHSCTINIAGHITVMRNYLKFRKEFGYHGSLTAQLNSPTQKTRPFDRASKTCNNCSETDRKSTKTIKLSRRKLYKQLSGKSELAKNSWGGEVARFGGEVSPPPKGAWIKPWRAYNGDLGAEPPAESRGRAPGQGVRGAESI